MKVPLTVMALSRLHGVFGTAALLQNSHSVTDSSAAKFPVRGHMFTMLETAIEMRRQQEGCHATPSSTLHHCSSGKTMSSQAR